MQQTSGGQLFDDDPHPINLLVSAIKIPNGEAHPLRVYVKIFEEIPDKRNVYIYLKF